jgi:hypothetical protein
MSHYLSSERDNYKHSRNMAGADGHANISVTLDTYRHVLPGLQEAEALRFEEGLQQVKVK